VRPKPPTRLQTGLLTSIANLHDYYQQLAAKPQACCFMMTPMAPK
jgi:hypothetical protein